MRIKSPRCTEAANWNTFAKLNPSNPFPTVDEIDPDLGPHFSPDPCMFHLNPLPLCLNSPSRSHSNFFRACVPNLISRSLVHRQICSSLLPTPATPGLMFSDISLADLLPVNSHPDMQNQSRSTCSPPATAAAPHFPSSALWRLPKKERQQNDIDKRFFFAADLANIASLSPCLLLPTKPGLSKFSLAAVEIQRHGSKSECIQM